VVAIAQTLNRHRLALNAVCIVAEKRGAKSERDSSLVGWVSNFGIRW
jgi:hypothetical protein